MADDLTVGNPVGDTTGNPPDPAAANGTSNQTGEASGQGATGQDTFIPKGLDLNTLPPNLRTQIEKINSDMVRGFTEKTTKLSETIKAEREKAIEAYRQKAELYEQVAGNDEFVKMWNDYVQKQSGQTPDPNDPAGELRKEMQAIKQQLATADTKQMMDAFADAQDEKGNRVNAMFDDLNSVVLGKQGEQEVSLLRVGIQLAPGKNLAEKIANGYKAMKQMHDTIFEAGKKAGMGRVQAKVLNGTNPPSGANGDVPTVTDRRPKSAKEALEMAKKGVMVSRD